MAPTTSPPATPGSYAYSTDGEIYDSDRFDSREAALAAAVSERGLEPGAVVWTGHLEPLEVEGLLDGQRFVEDLVDAASGAAGEDATEPWAAKLDGVTAEQTDDLESCLAGAVRAWLTEHGLPDPAGEIFGIGSVEEHVVTEPGEPGEFDDDAKTTTEIAKLGTDGGGAP